MGGKNVAIVHARRRPRAGGRRSPRPARCATPGRSARRRAASSSRARSRSAFLARAAQPQVAALPLGPVTDAARRRSGPVISERVARLDPGACSTRWTPSRSTSATFRRRGVRARLLRRRRRSFATWPPTPRSRRRELFGPVLAEFAADDLDHAIALANDTQYGLSASLFTRDLRSALALHRSHRRRPGARQRRHDRRRSARAVRRHEGLELGQSRAGTGGARVLHRDQDGADQSMTSGAVSHRRIRVVDSHTEGEPTRVVVDGWPQPAGAHDGRAARRPARAVRSPAPRRGVRAARPRRRSSARCSRRRWTPGSRGRHRLLQQRRPTSACAATA